MYVFVRCFVSGIHFYDGRRLCWLANRHTFGLTMPAPTGIALAIERKLISRWCYECSRPCRDAPKPVLCGKITSTRSSTTSISLTQYTSEVSNDRREGRHSMPTSRRHRRRLLRPYYGARIDCSQDRQLLAIHSHRAWFPSNGADIIV